MRTLQIAIATCVAGLAVTACHRRPDSATADQARQTAPSPSPASNADGVAFVCPMDRDIRSNAPGKCPRCGMQLVAGVPDLTEYHLDLDIDPQPIEPNMPTRLTFRVFDPWKNNPVQRFSVVHEKLFHAFIVSQDLQFFIHDHPTWENGEFHYTARFPKPGMYRILADFYPEAAAPQLVTQTLFVAGSTSSGPKLVRDDAPKVTENLTVGLSLSPRSPVAGITTQMRFTLTPADGIERYLGAWGHMLVASDDLIDMIHTHPSIADGSPEMQFNLIFPRARTYRIWVQFQRKGTVNTAHFDIPVLDHDATPSN